MKAEAKYGTNYTESGNCRKIQYAARLDMTSNGHFESYFLPLHSSLRFHGTGKGG